MKNNNNIQVGILIGMIKTALAGLAVAALFASCNKEEIAPASSNNVNSEASVIRAGHIDNSAAEVAEPGVAFMSQTHIGRGNVQSFEVKAFANGIVELRAIANLPFQGTIRYKISATNVQAIRDAFIASRFDRLETQYPGSRALPATVTTFVTCPECESLISKSVTDHNIQLPEALINLKATVAKLIELDKYLHSAISGVGSSDTAGQVEGNLSN